MKIFWFLMFLQLYNIRGKEIDSETLKMYYGNRILINPTFSAAKLPVKEDNDYLILSCNLNDDGLKARQKNLYDMESAEKSEINERNPERKPASEESLEEYKLRIWNKYINTAEGSASKIWKLLDEYMNTSINLKKDVVERLDWKDYVRIITTVILSFTIITAVVVVLCFVMIHKKRDQSTKFDAEATRVEIPSNSNLLQLRQPSHSRRTHFLCMPPYQKHMSIPHSKSEESIFQNKMIYHCPPLKISHTQKPS